MEPTGKHPGCRRDQQPPRKAILFLRFRSSRLQAGFTLIEVVVAAGIIAMVYGMILSCYVQSGLRAQWAGYSLAAQDLANEQIEQARSAVWDPATGKNELLQLNLLSTNYNSTNQTWTGYTTNILDIPYASTNYTIATNYVSIQLINLNNQTNPRVQVYMIRVDTVWPFFYRFKNLYYTNTAATLLAPDNRDPGSL
jgi:prepilin-type N-terminal cleavage/methylation domain-containing protein